MGLNITDKTHEYKVTIFTKNGGKYVGFAYSHISDPILFNREFFNKTISGDWCCLISELGTVTVRVSEIETINVAFLK